MQDLWAPLHLAVWNKHSDVVHELITAKCQINLRINNNAGALHLAAINGSDDIIEELLDAEIAPDMQTKIIARSCNAPLLHVNSLFLLVLYTVFNI